MLTTQHEAWTASGWPTGGSLQLTDHLVQHRKIITNFVTRSITASYTEAHLRSWRSEHQTLDGKLDQMLDQAFDYPLLDAKYLVSRYTMCLPRCENFTAR